MRPLCIYHAPCVDGFAAAWVVWRALRNTTEVEFHPGVYGEDPPDVTGREVYIVDFSYSQAVVMWMIENSKKLVILDHHKSAQENLSMLMKLYEHSEAVKIIFDMNRSGVGLAWDYFFPKKAGMMPTLLQYVQDYDLYKFEFGDLTRRARAALTSYPYDFEVWDKLMDEPHRLVQEGLTITRKNDKDVREILAETTRRMIIGGYNVPVANMPHIHATEAGAIMYADEKEPFVCCYWDAPGGRRFSLRSSKKTGIDVSIIAKAYGGGGHQHAAGFLVPIGWEGDTSELDILED